MKTIAYSPPAHAGKSLPPLSGWTYALIFALALVAYYPALQAGFIWDDHPGHVTKPELQSLAGLGRIWFDLGATQQYYPLLHSVFWLEHRLWGDAPFGYHFVNVLLHATAACLLGATLRRLAVGGASLAALLFTLHPVAVESVAWISEQKNTLSTVFYLSATLVYLNYDEGRTGKAYGLATGLFVLALLTKTVTATLPAALLVILWWRHGTLHARRDVRPLIPWFVPAAGAGFLTAWIEHAQIGAQGNDFAPGWFERILLAGRAAWFYAGKIIWPADLIFIYPRWLIDAGEAWQWLFPMAALGALSVLWIRRRRNPGLFAGIFFFVGTLFPALGFVNVFPFLYSYVADHFQYVASVGLIVLAAAGADALAARTPWWVTRTVAALVLAALGGLTCQHASTYRSVFTLYGATLAKNPDCWMAHNNLAIALVDAGRAVDALPHYERAIALRPKYAEAENNFGYALSQLGRHDAALLHLQRALQFRPTYAEAQNNLGAALMGLGRSTEGIAAFTESTRLNPRYALAHFNLGLAVASGGNPADAIAHFQRALKIDPRYAEAEINWGTALAIEGRVAEALPHFERALQINPNLPQAHVAFARALSLAGRLDEAIAHCRSALELLPDHAEAHYQLALALRQIGRVEEAEKHLRSAQQLGLK